MYDIIILTFIIIIFVIFIFVLCISIFFHYDIVNAYHDVIFKIYVSADDTGEQ